MKKQLIINADDFGMSREINEGIKIGIKKGAVTSVSIMSNMPFFDDAVKFLKNYPSISLGLHFNITEGAPLVNPNRVRNLIREDDRFFFWMTMIPRLTTRNIKLNEIEAELNAQYSKLKSTGLPITHIDSHHHIHLYPRIFQLISKFAEKNKIPSLRGDYFSAWNITLNYQEVPSPTQLIVNIMLLYSHLRYRRRKRFYKTDGFYDINWDRNLTTDSFITLLTNLPNGTTELICHLAIESEKGNKKFLSPRYKILKLLTNPLVKNHLTKNGIQLVNYKSNIKNNI